MVFQAISKVFVEVNILELLCCNCTIFRVKEGNNLSLSIFVFNKQDKLDDEIINIQPQMKLFDQIKSTSKSS